MAQQPNTTDGVHERGKLLTLHMAAGELGCTPERVRQLVNAGVIPAKNAGISGKKRSLRIHAKDLRDYIEGLPREGRKDRQ